MQLYRSLLDLSRWNIVVGIMLEDPGFVEQFIGQSARGLCQADGLVVRLPGGLVAAISFPRGMTR